MNDITNAAITFWNFLWPSVINVAIFVSIVVYLFPSTSEIVHAVFTKIPTRRIVRFLHSRTADALGMPKLVPFVMLFNFLLVLVITNDVAQLVGKIVPPTIIWATPEQYVALGETDELLYIWSPLADDTGINDLGAFIDEKWRAMGEDSGFSYWEERSITVRLISDYLKFYLYIAFISALVAMRYKVLRLRRVIMVVTLLIASYSVSVAYHLHCHERFVQGQLIVANQWVNKQQTVLVHSQKEINHRIQLIRREKARGANWWVFGMPFWHGKREHECVRFPPMTLSQVET